jgi:hypothetical protein
MIALEKTVAVPPNRHQHFDIDFDVPESWLVTRINWICVPQPEETYQKPAGGERLIAEETRTRSLTPLKTLEECRAEAQNKTRERTAAPESSALAQTIGSLWDGKRTFAQVRADAVAEQRRMRDTDWPD